MNGKKYPRTWELINEKQDWERLKVPGGWIVHHSMHHIIGGKNDISSECVVFVPDINHEWSLEDK